MFRARSVPSSVLVAFLAAVSTGQSANKPSSADPSSAARRSIVLAENGHCAEALPSLRTNIRQISDRELKRKLGLDGVHCAMTLNQASVALEFLQPLTREFPR